MSLFRSITFNTNNATGDAFGRMRISHPETIFDSKQIHEFPSLFWDNQQISGSGTAGTFAANTASTTLSVGATTAGRRVVQTFRRFNYQAGKSQLILLTGVLDKTGGGTGIIRRMGLFDDNNGLFFEDNAGTLSVVRRTYVTGSPVDNVVNQNNWNVDTMDGLGPSGITLNISKTNIYIIDFEWLGVGRVRMGVNIDGVTYVVHEFLNANNLEEVYMSTPNLPLRYEIINGGTGVASSLQQICSTVISEGGQQDTGIVRYASTQGAAVSTNAENSLFAVVGIRLKTGYLGKTIKFLNAQLQIQSATSKVEWVLLWNPTVAGVFTYSDVTSSAVQRALGATANTVTNGIQIAGGYTESGNASTGNAGSAGGEISSQLIRGSTISGTMDTLVLCVRPVGGTSSVDVEGSLTWLEVN